MKRLIKEYLLENWMLKATAVLLSLILWLFVKGEPGQEKFVPGVPLEVRVSPNMEVTEERPAFVDVTMTVVAFSDMFLEQSRPVCVVDLQGSKEGEHRITLSPKNIKIPSGSGIEVTKVSPQQGTLVLERTASKEVPIVVPVAGEPAHGYEIYGKYSTPSNLIITGPRSHIESVGQISTEKVSIAGLKQDAEFFVNLSIRDKFIRTSIATPLQIKVQIGPRR
jgi:YbbR domain-containing protein